MGLSKLEVYSLGIVAANKELSSNTIEVTPIEQTTMVSGELTDNMDKQSAKGQDQYGRDYEVSATTTNTVKAKWLAIGCPNRVTPPDVRRGEQVVLYKFADTDEGIYWATWSQDMMSRRLETVTYAFSGTAVEGVPVDASNTYYMEVSTHNGHVMLHTSQANGEFTTYDIVLDAKNGRFSIQDGIGNQFFLDSPSNQFHLENADGSFIDVTKMAVKIFTSESVDIETKTYSVKAQDSSLESTTNSIKSNTVHTGDLTEVGPFQLNGDMKTAGGTSGGGTGRIDLASDMHLQGDFRAEGVISGREVHSDTQNIG